MSLIEVRGLKKSFGSLEVLKGIDLTVEQGERIAIIARWASRRGTPSGTLRCRRCCASPSLSTSPPS